MKQIRNTIVLLLLALTSVPAVSDVLSLGSGKYMLSVKSDELIEVQEFYKQWHSEAANICNSQNYRYSLGPVETKEDRLLVIQRDQGEKSTVKSGPVIFLSEGLEC